MRELKSIDTIQKAVFVMVRPCAHGSVICSTCAEIPCGLIDDCPCDCHHVIEMLELTEKKAKKFLKHETRRL